MELSRLLQKSPLFSGVDEENIKKLCDCLDAREKKYAKDEFIFHADDRVRFVYLILSGSVHIIDEDFWGNRAIIETIEENTLFGEAYVFASMESHLVSVVSAEDSVILEMDPTRLFKVCPNGCECHSKLVDNTIPILSEKIVRLTEKYGHITRRTIRGKLLSYLSRCARQAHGSSFCIPYSRQQLADFLCVDRSALSHELSKLKKEGLVQYHKNEFQLLSEAYEGM